MSEAHQPNVRTQLSRARRRLWAQTFITRTLWCWCSALGLIAVWLPAQSLWLPVMTPSARLGIAGGVFAAATILAIWLTMRQAPSRLATALLVDERCKLRERVTTSYLLTPEQSATSAGLALMADVNHHIGKLDVASKFPVRINWRASMASAAAAALAIAAFYYRPPISQATSTGSAGATNEVIANAKQIDEKINQLKKREAEKRDPARDVSEELKKLDAELDQIANKPRSTKEQLKERIKEMTELEQRMQNRERELAERSQATKQQLQQLGKMGDKTENGEGPAKDLNKALAEGKLNKAKEEMERLAKKLKEDSLSAKEKQDLAKQLDNLQQKLEKLAQQKDKLEQLQKLAKENKISKEALKKELEQLKQDSQKLKSLQQLANQLAAAQRALKKGDGKQAGQSLDGATEQLKDMDQNGKDLDDLREQLAKLRDAKDACGQGQGQPVSQDEIEPSYSEMNKGGQGAGRRPLSDPMATKSFDAKIKGQFDKGKIVFDSYTPGGSFKKRSSAEMAGEVKQASQEEPEAVDQQRIPRAAKDLAKSYFKGLGGIKDAPAADKPK